MSLPRSFPDETCAQYARRVSFVQPQVAARLLDALAAEPTPEAAVVPSANRGLKSPTFGGDVASDAALAIVDFLTFSAQLSVLMQGEFGARVRAEAAEGEPTSIELLCRHVLHAVAPDSGLVLDSEVRGFRNFYARHMRIQSPAGKVVGFVAMGGEGQRGTFCVELTGEGCSHVKAWGHLREVLEGWGAKLSRVDCAHDDREGRYALADVQRWYDAGKFTTKGRPPAIGYAGYADGSGETIYIGKNTGNQQLCAYEKGKQLGDPSSPWIRFEGRFGAKYREIPYDILERPWEYLTGHFPALDWISELSTRMQTSVAKAAAGMAASLRHAKRQCGSVVNAIAFAFPSAEDFAAAVSSLLKRSKMPAWVENNLLGAAVIVPVMRPEFRPLLA
jgi:DNA relaxase NicK